MRTRNGPQQNFTVGPSAEVKERTAEHNAYKAPQAISARQAMNQIEFKSFAQKIRYQTNDGWDLIEAIIEVFQRACKAKADNLILESATWLADRGFGKPVQVGQLLDGEGNPVAFTLWSPATQEPIGDVITLQNGKVVEDTTPSPYAPPANQLEEAEPVVPVRPEDRDKYAYGPARPWGVGDPSPKPGE